MSQSHPIVSKNRGYEQNCQAAIITPNPAKQLKLFDIKLLNRTGVSCDLGFFKQLAPTLMTYYKTVSSVLTNITASIAAGTSTQIFTTTDNDGIIIQSKKEFHMLGFTVSTAQTGSPIISIKYWNGSSFVSVPNVIVSPVFTSTGYLFLFFNAPRNWVTGNGGLSGLDNTQFTLEITATSSTVGNVNAIIAGELQDIATGIVANGSFERAYTVYYPLYLEAFEAIIPYFSVSSTNNMVTISYSQED